VLAAQRKALLRALGGFFDVRVDRKLGKAAQLLAAGGVIEGVPGREEQLEEDRRADRDLIRGESFRPSERDAPIRGTPRPRSRVGQVARH
jgi:hypothetical protein